MRRRIRLVAATGCGHTPGIVIYRTFRAQIPAVVGTPVTQSPPEVLAGGIFKISADVSGSVHAAVGIGGGIRSRTVLPKFPKGKAARLCRGEPDVLTASLDAAQSVHRGLGFFVLAFSEAGRMRLQAGAVIVIPSTHKFLSRIVTVPAIVLQIVIRRHPASTGMVRRAGAERR